MDLKSGFPYWLLKNGLPATYPSLKKNHACEVLIIGGGISGVLAAYHISNAGFDVTVVDRRHFGSGSTSASTALIQYETDADLSELIEKYGEEKAIRYHELNLKAVVDLGSIIKKHRIDCGFSKRSSLYLASSQKDAKKLIKEFDIRTRAGFDLKLWNKGQIESKFGFSAPAALWSDNAAELDALKLTYGLLKVLSRKGVTLFDGTTITNITRSKKYSTAVTENGIKIKTRHIVIAGGYESEQFLDKKFSKFNSTYAIVSEPISPSLLWYRSSLIWESARPYLYFRTTPDNRMIIGGKDEPFYNPKKRDQLLNKKSKDLVKAFNKKFPHIPFEMDYSWSGTFGETKDSLPYISQRRGLNYVMGFGGNGITYSQLAGSLLVDLLKEKPNPDLNLFSFGR